ncbi:MAG: hypothetical protein K9M49_08135 [Candidatus Marinimicrobia bacterium]|nr:hypothetical protein [Candidatus Neomarinimicrobiota bacterium]MCF7850852.1 hypothetical protein [Candidatus Neomarinimicrobiota bacterium]MCF7905107.1 hypothetical protein [Candidatus Neomarinimicrobiota bacterium]
MGVKLHIVLVLMLAACLLATPVEQTGFIEGSAGYEFDTLSTESGRFIHQERISWGIRGDHQKFDYTLNLGGVLRGNSGSNYTSVSPEYGVRTNIRPSSKLGLAMFSYLRLRNPMQIRTDSLAYREYVHGVKLRALVSKNTTFSVSTGMKFKQISQRDTSEIGQQFVSFHLDQKMAGMQFRVTGETDAWSSDARGDQNTTMASVHWYGRPSKRLNWTASNTYFQANGYDFWRMSHRMRYDLSERRKIWATYQRGDVAYNSQVLLRQNFDVRYRFYLNQALGFDLLSKGNRVGVVDSLDSYHWRMYGASTHWQVSDKGFVRGNLDVGYKESYRYGKGLDVLLNSAEMMPLISGKRFDLYVQDDLSSEFFQRFDEEDDSRYDIRHKLRLTAEYSTRRSLRLGNNIRVHNHFGSDLDFSTDTLRNALIEEVFVKSYGQRTQLALFFGTIYALEEPENDLHFNVNSRIYHQLTPNLNFSFFNTYRFGSDIYEDYLWLNASFKYQTTLASYALMVRNYGALDSIGKQGTSVWLRFVRQI